MGQCQQYKIKGKKGWFLSTESHFDKQTAEGAIIRSNGLKNNEHQALGAVECEDGSYQPIRSNVVSICAQEKV